MAPQAPPRKDCDPSFVSSGRNWIQDAIDRAIPGLTQAIMSSLNATFGRRIQRLEGIVEPLEDMDVQVRVLRDEVAELRRRVDEREARTGPGPAFNTRPVRGSVAGIVGETEVGQQPPPRQRRFQNGVGEVEIPRRLRDLTRVYDPEMGMDRYMCPRCGQMYARSYVLVHVKNRCPMREGA